MFIMNLRVNDVHRLNVSESGPFKSQCANMTIMQKAAMDISNSTKLRLRLIGYTPRYLCFVHIGGGNLEETAWRAGVCI